MKTKATVNATGFTFLVLATLLLAPMPAHADTLFDLYGTAYDRSSVLEAGEGSSQADLDVADEGIQLLSLDDDSEIETHSTRARTVSPRYVLLLQVGKRSEL